MLSGMGTGPPVTTSGARPAQIQTKRTCKAFFLVFIQCQAWDFPDFLDFLEGQYMVDYRDLVSAAPCPCIPAPKKSTTSC